MPTHKEIEIKGGKGEIRIVASEPLGKLKKIYGQEAEKTVEYLKSIRGKYKELEKIWREASQEWGRCKSYEELGNRILETLIEDEEIAVEIKEIEKEFIGEEYQEKEYRYHF